VAPLKIHKNVQRRKKGGEWLWYTDLVEVSADVKPPAGMKVHRPLNKGERKSGETFLLVKCLKNINSKLLKPHDSSPIVTNSLDR